MNVVITCPTNVHFVFVPADRRDASTPQLPFTCPSLDDLLGTR